MEAVRSGCATSDKLQDKKINACNAVDPSRETAAQSRSAALSSIHQSAQARKKKDIWEKANKFIFGVAVKSSCYAYNIIRMYLHPVLYSWDIFNFCTSYEYLLGVFRNLVVFVLSGAVRAPNAQQTNDQGIDREKTNSGKNSTTAVAMYGAVSIYRL